MTAVTSVRGSEDDATRFKEIIAVMNQNPEGGGETEDEEERGRGRSGGDGGSRRRRRGRRPGSEVRGRSEETEERLRWRLNQVEKNRVEVTSRHNQELVRLQAELTRLRSSVERGEAQRAELQYQLTTSQRVADRAAELSRDKHALTERAAQLQLKVQELQKVLDVTRQVRDEDQHALRQEVEEGSKLIRSLGSENRQLQQILQEQEEASERRRTEVQREREKEAEVKRRLEGELKDLREREERSRREKEASDQRVRSLESSVEAERAAHLESKFNSEIVQLRARDLEAALAAERSGHQEAQCTLELLRVQFREVERVYNLERERSDGTERALERTQELLIHCCLHQLQAEYGQCKSDLTVALETERKTNSDLSGKLEDEKERHRDACSMLEQAAKTQCDTVELHQSFVQQIRDTLGHHIVSGCGSPAVHDGKPSSVEVLQLLKATLVSSQQCLHKTEQQIQDQLLVSERLQTENQTLHQLTSDQTAHMQRLQEAKANLEEEVRRLQKEGSDWSTQNHSLRAELQEEREERVRQVQKMNEDFQEESEARLSFLHCLYQRLLTGGVLLTQPHSILGNFTWKELCDVISEHVDRLTSDLQKASDKITNLEATCEKKSVCVRELQRHQQRALSHLVESVRRREEAWSDQQRQLHKELQVCRSQCDSLRENVSSLERHRSSLTSDLSRLRGLVSRSRSESSSLLSACVLLAGTLKHTCARLQRLREQKTLLCRRLAAREELEEEVRRLADALGAEEEEDEEEERRKRAVMRWRRSVCAVLAMGRWRSLAKDTTVMFRLEGGGSGLAVCVCGDTTMATQKDGDGDEGRDVAYARWLRSKRLSSTIMSSMADLQGALAHTGSAPPDVTSAARLGLSRLLDQLLNQSEVVSSVADGDSLSKRLQMTHSRPNMKALVSTIQQHFLLFSQRLHSAEVERRSLRLEASNWRRGLRREEDDPGSTVPAECFQRVCSELRQTLDREQEAQLLIREQTDRLRVLQLQVDAHESEQMDAQRALDHAAQALSEARKEVSRKERSLRILGKHLLAVQRERKRLEKKMQRRAEDETRDGGRLKDSLKNHKVTDTVALPDIDTPPPARLPEEEAESEALPLAGPAPSSSCTNTKDSKAMKKKTSRGHVTISHRQ